MKKSLIFIISILVITYAQSQTHPKIENYQFGNLDVNVMVIPFGMDHPIKIGTMSKSGDINFDFPKALPELSKEAKETFISDVAYTLFDVCDNSSEIDSNITTIASFDTGAISLWTKDNRYVGVVFAVFDEKMVPWIEDSAYMEPILGSYYELVYVDSPVQFKGGCIQTQLLDEDDTEIIFNYNLDLKAGFNFIEYKIESIFKTDPNVKASFPDKVSVSNVEGIPNCKWIGKYF
ncbi:hypothetical protein DFQ11_101395 [Winogradskyella epiphytica]|uniref:GLPGLI family protein n=1 Tax=Winogradskyella epiphytica TaxID=262005 RepID=A0A2V4XA80_9FLAO|nr:hypothetical protein [Winogradskyella epiphytica]PYE82965.1 hypothetical protein DFQ11_101395 [Winogradskyella epiphytica]GGW54868.1 hypothetical protein GCM10008085_02640 [Winogradskyella epiphytica]